MTGSDDYYFNGGYPEDDERRQASYKMYEKIKPLLLYVLEHDFPTFGICFGHQLIGMAQGAEVVYDQEQQKTGSWPVHLREDLSGHPYFQGVPERFYAQYGHRDTLDRIPDGACLIMNGNRCKVSGLIYSPRVVTVQFHPEVNRENMIKRVTEMSRSYLPAGEEQQFIESIKDSRYASQILTNFLNTAGGSA